MNNFVKILAIVTLIGGSIAYAGNRTRPLPRDVDGVSMQTSGSFQPYNDGETIYSPLSVTGATATLGVPDFAAEIIIKTSGALRLFNNVSGTGYFVLGDGESITLGVSDMDNIYLKSDTSSSTVSFLFTTLNW